jgi:hypothetical protein
MYSTIVPPARASADQSTVSRSFCGSSCPVTNVTDVAVPRCVTGIPAYAGRRERLRLLAAAAEHERIAALQAHDALALVRQPDQQRVDLLLARGVGGTTALADVVQLEGPATSRHGREREQRGIGQRVVDDRVANDEQLAAPQRE